MPDCPRQLLTPHVAEAIVRRALPAATVTEVVARTGGQLSTIYEVRCTGPVDAVIVKVYSDQWRWKLAKEVHVYRLLAHHGVRPIPTILHAEPTSDLLDCAFTVMTLLSGDPLSMVSPRLEAAETHQIYRQLGATLSAIHRISQSAYGYLTNCRILDPQPSNIAYMSRQFTKKLREFTELGGDPALHNIAQTHVAERAGLFAHCPDPVLCHNDFHEGNVLVTKGPDGWTVTGFIDVENAIAADPLLDLAKTDYYSIRGYTAKLSGLLGGYGPLADDWPDRLALYRLYHALELWDWFASIGDTAPLPGITDDIRQLTT
ncbi:MAG: aminoglycoside phosphotransferase family protein [Actinomycetota bacterium]|nr:aminoglycoside phosphotransferase family protein [Actinomycetota bacterium]